MDRHTCADDATWFDRTFCPEPCGSMHTRCERHGEPLDYCAFEHEEPLADWERELLDNFDPVQTPEHYRWMPVEAIEITELFNFNMGNALKYIIRADHKGRPVEDLLKARWYVDRELKRRKAESE